MSRFLKSLSDFPFLGFGVGLRHEHFPIFLEKKYSKTVRWVEALTENYLPWENRRRLRPFSVLEKIRKDLPVALHGVSLSVGSVAPVNMSYLQRLKEFAEEIEPAWISDHLCWTGTQGENMHDLLPLPYTQEAITKVVEKIARVQDFLKRRLLIENVSSYVEFKHSTLTEWEFLSEVVQRADCGILLDINNIYVSSVNHEFDPMEYLSAIPAERVGQIHLAGHTNKGDYCIDTHDEPICDEVFALYRWYSAHNPQVSTMVEWDDQIPAWARLEKEVEKVKKHYQKAIEGRAQEAGHHGSFSVSI